MLNLELQSTRVMNFEFSMTENNHPGHALKNKFDPVFDLNAFSQNVFL